jgi:hypothetical protein
MWCEMTEPVIEKCLDASTGHISYEDSILLDMVADNDSPEHKEFNPCLPIVYKYDFGYFVYTYPNDNHIAEEEVGFADRVNDFIDRGFSKEFIALLKYARSLGCKYLQLDADGAIYAEFPMIEW